MNKEEGGRELGRRARDQILQGLVGHGKDLGFCFE